MEQLAGTTRLRAWVVGAALWLAAFLPAAHANPQWMEELRYLERDEANVVQIVFSESVYYLSHFPPESGESLTVYLRVPALAGAALPIREEIKGRFNVAFPLASVAFEADEREVVLRMKFTGKTEYRVTQGPNDKSIALVFPKATTPQSQEDRIKALLNQGRDALTRGDADQAIQIFSGILSLPEHPFRADALELLGVARERKKQRAHAKAAYEEYLAQYPKGEGADRVRQRLADLLSGELKPQEKLKAVKPATEPASPWTHSGSIAQYYYRGVNDIDPERDTVDQSTLLSQFSWNSQLRGTRFDSRVVANISHTYDALADAGENAEINSLYGQVKDKQGGWLVKLGRQSSPGGGVLGRFDGLLAQYEVAPSVQLDAIAGYTVEISDDNTVQTQRPFWSVAADLGPYWDYLEAMPYYVRANADGMLDREAAGYELRFFHPRGNAFNLVDYDISYNLLNIFLLRGQYSFLESSSIYGFIDARRSPPVATTNALIGELSADSLDDLRETMTEEHIRELARKRTGDTGTVTLGASHTFNPKLQLSGDVTMSKQRFPIEPVQVGVARETQDDEQTDYSVQIVTSKWINERDTTLLGLRYTDAQTYNSGSATLAHRLPVGQAWRLDARLRWDRRETHEGEILNKKLPTFRVEYRPVAAVELQLELAAEWWVYAGNTVNESYRRLLGNIGYRWLF